MPILRSLTQEEMADYNKLSSICFSIPTRTEDLAPKEISPKELRQTRGIFDDDGTLLGAMILIEMTCRFEGHDCPFIGVGGVVTDPAQRRQGAIRRIFQEDLPRLRSEGFVLSALYPFSHVFYRKFGYELGIMRRNIKLSPDCLRPDLHRAASIRRLLPEEDGTDMAAVYTAYMADKNLAVLREQSHWNALRRGTPWEDRKHCYVLYDDGGEPIAYWVGTMTKEGYSITLNIDDMAYTCREGMEAIFAMLRSMNELSCIRMTLPQDMPIYHLVEDPYNAEETISCGGMVRVLDAGKLLSMLPAPARKGSCTLRLWDEQIPENSGCFTITGDGRELWVRRTDAEPDLECSINGLSALILSDLGLKKCLDARLVTLLKEEQLPFLEDLFHPRQQHLHNYF